MEEEDSSAKEERESSCSTGRHEYYTHRHILQQLISYILKCLGVESNSPQEKSEEPKDNKTDDPADHDAPSSASEPEMKTLEDGVSISDFRRVPPRPPISSGGGSQHN